MKEIIQAIKIIEATRNSLLDQPCTSKVCKGKPENNKIKPTITCFRCIGVIEITRQIKKLQEIIDNPKGKKHIGTIFELLGKLKPGESFYTDYDGHIITRYAAIYKVKVSVKTLTATYRNDDKELEAFYLYKVTIKEKEPAAGDN